MRVHAWGYWYTFQYTRCTFTWSCCCPDYKLADRAKVREFCFPHFVCYFFKQHICTAVNCRVKLSETGINRVSPTVRYLSCLSFSVKKRSHYGCIAFSCPRDIVLSAWWCPITDGLLYNRSFAHFVRLTLHVRVWPTRLSRWVSILSRRLMPPHMICVGETCILKCRFKGYLVFAAWVYSLLVRVDGSKELGIWKRCLEV